MKLSNEDKRKHHSEVVAILRKEMEAAEEEYRLAERRYESAKATGGLV